MLVSPDADSRFRLTENRAAELASEFGTPLYVLDEAHFRNRVQRYLDAIQTAYPSTAVSYASKANSTFAILSIAHSLGLSIDVASEGELRAALEAGIPAKDCHFHGNNKGREELTFALSQGVGQIIIDNFHELELLEGLKNEDSKFALRLAPGVDPKTHKKISTGSQDTKFGFSISDGAAEAAVLQALHIGLPLIGIHCHIGSQLKDPNAHKAAAEIMGGFARAMYQRHRFFSEVVNLGGGLGVRYEDKDEVPAIESLCRLQAKAFFTGYGKDDRMPTLAIEPGRALIAESGVTLYEVGGLKSIRVKGHDKTYVSVNGGLSDNPRPAMYESRYSVNLVRNSEADPMLVTVSGKHCETDTLFEDVWLPEDLHSGDILQVLTTGAYNSAMANNYNRLLRPATVLLRESGEAFLAQTRENWKQLFAREQLPDDLRRSELGS